MCCGDPNISDSYIPSLIMNNNNLNIPFPVASNADSKDAADPLSLNHDLDLLFPVTIDSVPKILLL